MIDLTTIQPFEIPLSVAQMHENIIALKKNNNIFKIAFISSSVLLAVGLIYFLHSHSKKESP
jgi:hypothetical protein